MTPFDRRFFIPTETLLELDDGDFLVVILANLDILLDVDDDLPLLLLATASASLFDFAIVPDRTAFVDLQLVLLLFPSFLAPWSSLPCIRTKVENMP